MANSNRVMVNKLKDAINQNFDAKILFNIKQWYSEKHKRVVTVYVLKQAIKDEESGKYKNVEIFSAYSMIQIVLFLRDLWYELNGWEVPDDNKKWTKVKEQYYKKHEPTDMDVTIKDNKKHIIREDAYDELKK